MTTIPSGLGWRSDRLGEALRELVRRSGLVRQSAVPAITNPIADAGRLTDETSGRWIEHAAAALGVEAEEVESPYADLEATLSNLAPAIVRVTLDSEERFLVLLRRRRNRLVIVAPDLQQHTLSTESVRQLLAADLEREATPHVDRLLSMADSPARGRARARRFLLHERLAAVRIAGLWLVRTLPTASFWQLVRTSAVPRLFAGLFAAHSGQYALLIGGWFMIARGLRHETLSTGWLIGWALVMASAIPLRLVSSWTSARLTTEVGAILRRRLLVGTLYLAPDETRHRGLGDLLSRVIDTEIVEALGTSGGVLALTAGVELAAAVAIMAMGAAPIAHALGLAVCLGALAALWPRYFKEWERGAELRLTMSDAVLEGIIGHQTRLAQQAPERWHEQEDQTLRAYLHAAGDADRLAIATTVVPRVWLVAATACLVPVVATAGTSTPTLAFSLGGILLAYRTLVRIVALLSSLAAALLAWRKMEPLLREIPPLSGTLDTFAVRTPASGETVPGPVAVAEDLVYRYDNKSEPILKGCSLSLQAGDRVMLQGASGSGKSTLCALLAGVRQPSGGLLLVDGLDRGTLGQDEWRRRVVAAPQFHDNHIFSATLAFNLLMGRRWPPQRGDIEAAAGVCRELGLGPLLEKMPAGILQMVGDMGWQLSHGERSRVFVARTLLQDTRLIILDESLAALDPETVAQCAKSVLARAPALVLIAHP